MAETRNNSMQFGGCFPHEISAIANKKFMAYTKKSIRVLRQTVISYGSEWLKIEIHHELLITLIARFRL
jgi:hypothetical protein